MGHESTEGRAKSEAVTNNDTRPTDPAELHIWLFQQSRPDGWVEPTLEELHASGRVPYYGKGGVFLYSRKYPGDVRKYTHVAHPDGSTSHYIIPEEYREIWRNAKRL
jgi:hypothetical protein